MRLDQLAPPPGARRRRKRVGRGIGSGHGKTATRGTKGQLARGRVRAGFEGGQKPLILRLRKRRGGSRDAMPIGLFRRRYAIVNVGALEAFEPGEVVTPELLVARRVVRRLWDGVRVLGEGKVTKPLRVQAHHFSGSARAKLEAGGGQAEVVSGRPRRMRRRQAEARAGSEAG